MAIDTSMYRNMQAPDIMGNYAQGLSMRDMIDKQDRAKNLDKAFASGMVTGPDGKVTYDGQKVATTMGELGLGKEMAEYQQTLKTQSLAEQEALMKKQLQEVDLIGRAAMSVTDQASYDNALASLQQQKIDVSQMPQAYDPNLVKSYAARALSAKDQLEQKWKEKDYGLREREVRAKEIEARSKKIEAGNTGKNLPIEKKKMIETLANKNAGKIAIRNQIIAVMDGWDALPDDQKVAAGRQLIKTLNSTEGADAVGAEESKRLGGKLEFALGNLTNSNPVQFGRDLKGFKTQALNTANAIGDAVEANNSVIDQAYGRETQPKTKTKTWEGVTYALIGDEWVPQ